MDSVLLEEPQYTVRTYDPDPPPVTWQKNAMDGIHVYEVDGPSTCVFLDKDGRMQGDHCGYAAVIPIEYFAPDPESQMKLGEAIARQLHSKRFLEAAKRCHRDKKTNDITDYAPVLETIDIASIREYLEKTRGHGYRDCTYSKEDRDKMQINKVFVELNKYPEISKELFTKFNFFMALVGNDGLEIDKLSGIYKADEAGGYYDHNDNLMALSMQTNYHIKGTKAEMTRFDDLVAEEIMHALDKRAQDYGDHAFSDNISPAFMDVLEKHTAKLKSLFDKMKREFKEDSREIYTPEEQAFKGNLLKFADSKIQAEIKLRLPWKRDRNDTALLILSKAINQLREGHTFTKEPEYADLTEQGVKRELFAKLAKHILLNRYNNHHGDQKMYKAVEEYIYTPVDDVGHAITSNPLKELRDLLDQKKRDYERSTNPEDEMPQKVFAEHIARNVEKWSRGSTGYIFDYGKSAAKG